MRTDWMVNEPMDFEYHEYKMLAYFQKVAEDLDNLKLYPHFRDISLHYASFSTLKSKDKYITLANEMESIDDEILISDLVYHDIPNMSVQDYAEYKTIVKYGEEKFQDYFLIAKSIWQGMYESLWLALLENDDELGRGKGFVFFDYGDKNYLYRYELKPFKRNRRENRLVLKKIKITKNPIDIPKLISEDPYEKKNPNHPIFVLKIKNNSSNFLPLDETIIPLVKRKINSFIQQTKKQEKNHE
jgi:hypothetical protein